MDTRICNVCGAEKPLSEDFYRKTIFVRKDGTQRISFMKKCLICHNAWQAANYAKNKISGEDDGYRTCKHCGKKDLDSEFETAFMCIVCFKSKKSEQDREWRETHKEEKSLMDKEYREQNKDKIAEQAKNRYLANPEYYKQKSSDNYKEKVANDPLFVESERIRGREKAAKSKPIRNKQRKERRKVDPIYRLRAIVSKSVWAALKLNGGSKAGNSFTKYFSYSIDDLKLHLESLFEPWMNWGNQGRYNLKIWDDDDPTTWTWQLDHIVPQSTFDYKSMEEQSFRDCWSLNNLRPLSAKQNYLDGISRIRHKK
jgi:hypothetical protein